MLVLLIATEYFAVAFAHTASPDSIWFLFFFFFDVRFSCAKRVNRESADLDFKGDRRVWDGETVKRLPGKSAMYIVVEDEVHYAAYVFNWKF